METFIFTETVNCSEITKVMLRSFYRHHPNKKIHIFGGQQDFLELHDEGKHENAVLIDIKQYDGLEEKYKIAHQGTAYVFALVISGRISQKYDSFIHIDSDILFKKESLSLIENAFKEGFDIVGSRRCYGNNPSNIPNLSQFPDSISTYFLGMKIDKIPYYDFDKLCKYCEGAEHPLGWLVLDFFDGVTHGAINNGAKIKFLDQNSIGGQDEFGKKSSKFTSNLHFDCGSHLIHFGGVGSGYAFSKGKKGIESPYYNWAMGRYSLFKRFFEKESIGFNEPTVYGSDGRWVFGNYDDNILQNLEIDTYFDGNKELYRWEKDHADHLRYEFDLNEHSFVIDAGGYDGQWAKAIFDKYKCLIHVYEPVPEFYHKIQILFYEEYKVNIYCMGLSDSERLEKIYLNDNASSIHKSNSLEPMTIIMEDVGLYDGAIIDLLKINTEGSEYELLDRIIKKGFQGNFKNILVQFHTFVDGYEEKRKAIHEELSKTHRLEWCYEYVWELWRINDIQEKK
jgi:FkbM family methyltransferase